MRIAVFASGEGTNFQALLDETVAGRIPGQIVLLVSARAEAGAVRRAREASIPVVVLDASKGDADAYAKALVDACTQQQVELVCLAGHMQRIPAEFVAAYRDRVVNVHPALLPAFGGKGMYGLRVHQAVLDAGVRVTGATVHVVDEEYDHGPIVLQQTVPVIDGDDAAAVQRRVQEIEHAIYPRAVRLFCEGRISVEGRRVRIQPESLKARKVRRALLSVSDKTGLVELARELHAANVELVSTGGTFKTLLQAGLPVRSVEALTGSPEMLGGRVKTLHPRVHGGILFKRDDADHALQVATHQIEPIDLVVVNLYPFAEAAKKHKAFDPELIEEIDIGGPTLVRAAAKNCDSVAIVTDPADYAPVAAEIREHASVSDDTRRRLAGKAFALTARYDAMIASVLGPKDQLVLQLKRVQELRYGENPHQKAALYRTAGADASFTQLHGKELSFNNILDAEGCWDLCSEFAEPAAVFFKHVTPCGVGVGVELLQAYRRAWDADPVCAFGGILAVNRPLGVEIAQAIGEVFLEVIIAPSFTADALQVLQRKKNLRLLARTVPPSTELQFRSFGADVLVQDPDRALWAEGEGWKVVTKRAPTDEEAQALRFAWPVCKHVRSNAIVVASDGQTIGIGAGQMSRVDSVKVAGMKMAQLAERQALPKMRAAASDAFFPFRDGLDELVRLGVTAVVQPGGSVRDDEVFRAADEHGIAMVLSGMRHFRH